MCESLRDLSSKGKAALGLIEIDGTGIRQKLIVEIRVLLKAKWEELLLTQMEVSL